MPQFGAQPDKFRYTLSKTGLGNFISYPSTNTAVLPNAPDGWDETIVKWERQGDYYGLIRSLSLPLEFVLDGAWLLRGEFYTFGIEAKVQLLVEKLDPFTWKYYPLALGEVDFSQFEDNPFTIKVNLMEGGISAQIKAFENIKYEIDLDSDPDVIDMLLTPIKLIETAGFITGIAELLQSNTIAGVTFPTLTITYNEQKSNQPSVQDVVYEQNNAPNFTASNKWFFKANANTTVDINILLEGTTTGTVRFQIINNLGTILQTIDIIPTFPIFPFNINQTFSIPMTAGQELFFVAKTTTNPSNAANLSNGSITLEYDTVSEATPCKGIRAIHLYERLVAKMNEDTVTPTQSNLLNTDWYNLVITGGDAIRQLTGSKIKTSFKDLFNSVNACFNAGFGIEGGVPAFERKDYFFRASLESVNVGNVKDFKLQVYDAYMYNSVKIGFENQDYDELNGRDEVHSEQIYSLPITRMQRELNLISPYRADPYGIEFIRINLTEKKTSDANSDNDVFMIIVKDLPNDDNQYEPKTNEDYPVIEGVRAGDSYYNLDITPKQNLLRHGYFLHSFLDKRDAYRIMFRSGLKNVALRTVDINGRVVDEDSNLDISALEPQMFLPYLCTITTKLPRNVLALLDGKPYGCIRFNYNGEDYRMFIISVSVPVGENEEREIQGLMTTNNNLLSLVQ